MHALFKKRFNFIDIFATVLVLHFLYKGDTAMAVCIFVVGALMSASGEVYFKTL